ncbi:MAG: hypothetical protein Rhob2KO_52960 [Rhodopirellula baltica]
MIGANWLCQSLDGDRPRLFEKDDFVRRELEWSHERAIDVLPVLIDGARMPKSKDLPESIRFISGVNAISIRSGQDFEYTVYRLISHLQKRYGFPETKEESLNVQFLCWIGVAAIVVGSFCSLGLIGIAMGEMLDPVGNQEEVLWMLIAGELMGPVALGSGVVAVGFARRRSCVLSSRQRTPAFLNFDVPEKEKHPDTYRGLVLAIATLGWGLVSFVPALFFCVRAYVKTKDNPSRFYGLRCVFAGIAFALMGVAISVVVQWQVASTYSIVRKTNAAQLSLNQGDYQAAERIASTVVKTKPRATHCWVVIGKSKVLQNQYADAIDPLSRAIEGLSVFHQRERTYLVPSVGLRSCMKVLVDCYELRIECYLATDQDELVQSDEEKIRVLQDDFQKLFPFDP